MKHLFAIALLALAATLAHAATPAAPAAPAFIGEGAGATTTIPAGTHGNVLNWSASTDATTGTTSNFYRLSAGGTCPATINLSAFTLLQTLTTASGPASDTAVAAGHVNSYVVTNVIGGVESLPSNCISLTTPTFPPSALAGTAQ